MEIFVTKIKLILVIFGDEFSTEELTDLIKIKPSQTWSKGDVIPIQKGVYRKDSNMHVRKETVWEYSTGFIKTLVFENVSEIFEKMFKNKVIVLKNYIEEKGADVVVDIVVEIADENIPSIHFNRNLLKLCEHLGAEIDIDIYQINNQKKSLEEE